MCDDETSANDETPENRLDEIMQHYQSAFSEKEFPAVVGDEDVLMNAFCVTDEMKRVNMQYWGRELGMCWQRLVISIFENQEGFARGITIGQDEICDLVYREDAIDTKYRVGSGDSGTLKKFRENRRLIREVYQNRPVMMFLREDNLHAAITSIGNSGWVILTGDDSFDYIRENSGFDLEEYLISNRGNFSVL